MRRHEVRLSTQLHIINNHHGTCQIGKCGCRDIRSQSIAILSRQSNYLLQNQLQKSNIKNTKKSIHVHTKLDIIWQLRKIDKRKKTIHYNSRTCKFTAHCSLKISPWMNYRLSWSCDLASFWLPTWEINSTSKFRVPRWHYSVSSERERGGSLCECKWKPCWFRTSKFKINYICYLSCFL